MIQYQRISAIILIFLPCTMNKLVYFSICLFFLCMVSCENEQEELLIKERPFVFVDAFPKSQLDYEVVLGDTLHLISKCLYSDYSRYEHKDSLEAHKKNRFMVTKMYVPSVVDGDNFKDTCGYYFVCCDNSLPYNVRFNSARFPSQMPFEYQEMKLHWLKMVHPNDSTLSVYIDKDYSDTIKTVYIEVQAYHYRDYWINSLASMPNTAYQSNLLKFHLTDE